MKSKDFVNSIKTSLIDENAQLRKEINELKISIDLLEVKYERLKKMYVKRTAFLLREIEKLTGNKDE